MEIALGVCLANPGGKLFHFNKVLAASHVAFFPSNGVGRSAHRCAIGIYWFENRVMRIPVCGGCMLLLRRNNVRRSNDFVCEVYIVIHLSLNAIMKCTGSTN